MARASLGSLVVSLGLDAAEYVDGLNKSEYQARQFVRNTQQTILRVTGTFTLLAGAVAAPLAAMRAMTGELDDLSKAAQRAQMPTEEFTALAYAGDLADVSIENLQASMGRLSRAQADAVRNATGPQADAFRRLGIEARNVDGSLRRSSEVFADFADRYREFGPSTELMAAGMEIFGRSFQTLIPLIKGGKEGLEEAKDEAREFGLVVSTEAGAQAEQFNDNLTRMAAALNGVKRSVVGEALPAFVDLTDELVKIAKEIVGTHSAFRALVNDGTIRTWAQNTALAIGVVVESVTFLGKSLRSVAGSFETVFADLDVVGTIAEMGGPAGLLFEKNRKALSDALEKRNKTLAEANARYRDLWEYNATWLTDSLRSRFAAGNASDFDVWSNADSGLPGRDVGIEPPTSQTKTTKRAVDQAELTGEQRALIAAVKLYQDVEKRASDYGATVEWLDRLFFDGAISVEQYDVAMSQLAKTTETFGKGGSAALKQFAEGWLDNIDPMREFIRNIERVDAAMSAGFLSPEQAERIKQAIADIGKELTEAEQFIQQFYENAQRNLGDGLYDMMQGNFDSIGQGFKSMIQRMIADAAAADLMKWLFGGKDAGLSGGVIGGFFSGLFGGARASGGPVSAGKAYLVGERGPELFSPASSGAIVPNHALGGDNITVNVHVDSRTDAAEVRRAVQQGVSQSLGMALESRQRYGAFARG